MRAGHAVSRFCKALLLRCRRWRPYAKASASNAASGDLSAPADMTAPAPPQRDCHVCGLAMPPWEPSAGIVFQHTVAGCTPPAAHLLCTLLQFRGCQDEVCPCCGGPVSPAFATLTNDSREARYSRARQDLHPPGAEPLLCAAVLCVALDCASLARGGPGLPPHLLASMQGLSAIVLLASGRRRHQWLVHYAITAVQTGLIVASQAYPWASRLAAPLTLALACRTLAATFSLRRGWRRGLSRASADEPAAPASTCCSSPRSPPADCDLCYGPMGGPGEDQGSGLFGPDCMHGRRRIHASCALLHLQACLRYKRPLACPECSRPAQDPPTITKLFAHDTKQQHGAEQEQQLLLDLLDDDEHLSPLSLINVSRLVFSCIVAAITIPRTPADGPGRYVLMSLSFSLLMHAAHYPPRPWPAPFVLLLGGLHVLASFPLPCLRLGLRLLYVCGFVGLLDIYLRLALSVRRHQQQQEGGEGRLGKVAEPAGRLLAHMLAFLVLRDLLTHPDPAYSWPATIAAALLAVVSMQVPSIRVLLLHVVGGLAWGLVTLSLQLAGFLWCALTLELVAAGPTEEKVWVVLQSVSSLVILSAGVVAFVRRPFMLHDMPM